MTLGDAWRPVLEDLSGQDGLQLSRRSKIGSGPFNVLYPIILKSILLDQI